MNLLVNIYKTVLFYRCSVSWKKTLSLDLTYNRLNVSVESSETDILDINITSTLIELYKQVKENWTKDYYKVKDTKAVQKPDNPPNPAYRSRSPFIPYALKNETGSLLGFTTIITDINQSGSYKHNANWISVEPGQTVPFSFTGRGNYLFSKLFQLVKFCAFR